MYKIVIMAFLLCGIIFPQSIEQKTMSGFSTELNITILSIDFSGSVEKLEKYFIEKNAVIIGRNDNRRSMEVTLLFTGNSTREIEEFCETLGMVAARRLSTINNEEKITALRDEISYLKNTKAEYEAMIARLDVQSEKYAAIWSETRTIDEKIFEKEKEFNLLLQRENLSMANIRIEDEVTSPETTDIDFVNMPGLEFSYLKIENPKSGISSTDYNGIFLKYLFTRGKSFALLGAYKSIPQVTDTAQWSELFIVGFGQDFYSRYLGGGEQGLFNLYSGYVIGYAYITNSGSYDDLFFISPTIGLELYKNKYILLDSKVSYFVPFTYNKNLRGISYSLSFNFVF
ncbi:MAG: hypothetical protein K9I69_02475 [Ignavibacteriales bacterium]|nr:hypothetical protein [Ignavibacteriales bacterium]MCF8307067.1 hypothetical protein [Ignavibacteriales bacterium]MCF8316690.1 hypothetical protein [Ignavibacteriales bacterium]MCF8438353.1 hypothetical protein [Ignavibacteriales bacterium]